MLSGAPAPLGRQPLPRRRRPAAARRSPCCSTPGRAAARPRRPGRLHAELGQLLPHLAMLVAVATVGAVAMTGVRPSPGTIAGLVVLRGARRRAPVALRPRRAADGRPPAAQRGLLPLAGPVRRRRRRHPRRRPAHHLGLAGPRAGRSAPRPTRSSAVRCSTSSTPTTSAGTRRGAADVGRGLADGRDPMPVCCSLRLPDADGGVALPRGRRSPTCATTPTSAPSSCTAAT